MNKHFQFSDKDAALVRCVTCCVPLTLCMAPFPLRVLVSCAVPPLHMQMRAKGTLSLFQWREHDPWCVITSVARFRERRKRGLACSLRPSPRRDAGQVLLHNSCRSIVDSETTVTLTYKVQVFCVCESADLYPAVLEE